MVFRRGLSIRQKRGALQLLTVSSPENRKEELSPRPLLRLLGDFGNSLILDAALEYDFFMFIHRGFHTYGEIAQAAGTDARATRILLDSLITLSLIEKRAGQYFLTPLSETFLIRGQPDYIGDFRYVALGLLDGMARLKETLKTGRPLGRIDTGGELAVWEKLIVGIIPVVQPVATALCELLAIGVERKGFRILDIAGGSSIFGMTILERDPSAQVAQLDWPNVNEVAKKLNRERGLEGKIRFIDGEFHSAEIEQNHYDLILASNFCRFESPAGNQELFTKVYGALRSQGLLVINDLVPNEERTAPAFPLRFSVFTLTHTPEGESWTLSEYSRWLHKAGYSSIKSHSDIPHALPGTTFIIAEKN